MGLHGVVTAFSGVGLLSALGGIIFNAGVMVGDPWASRGLEFDAIAAVVIGGTSLFGGVGGRCGAASRGVDHHHDQQRAQPAQRFSLYARPR